MAKKKPKSKILPGRKPNYVKAVEDNASGLYKPKVATGTIGVTPRGGTPIRVSAADAKARRTYKPGEAESANADLKAETTKRLKAVESISDGKTLRKSKNPLARLVGQVPRALKAAGGAIEDVTARDTPIAKRAASKTRDRLGSTRYGNAIREMKASAALEKRPGRVDTGMSIDGVNVSIPDTWDMDLYREVAHDLRMSGSGGATGGAMSLREAHDAAAKIFRKQHGDERNWDKQGKTRDKYGNPITVDYAIQSKKRAIARETARLTGKSVWVPGIGDSIGGYALPDEAGRELRELLDSIEDAKGGKSVKKNLTAVEKVLAYDVRGIHFPDKDDPPGKESELTLTKLGGMRKALEKGIITIDEYAEQAKPLFDQLAKNAGRKAKAKREEKAKVDTAAATIEDRKQAKIRQDAETDEAKMMHERAVDDVAVAKARIKELRESILDLKEWVDYENPETPKQLEIAGEMARQKKELAGLRDGMDEMNEAVKSTRDTWDDERKTGRQYLRPAAEPNELGGGDLHLRLGGGMGGAPTTDVNKMDPTASAIAPGAELPEPTATLEPDTVLQGIVPNIDWTKKGYDGRDGIADGAARVVQTGPMKTTLEVTGPEGETKRFTIDTPDVDNYYAPIGSDATRRDISKPTVGMRLQSNEPNGEVYSVSEVSEDGQQVTLTVREDADKGAKRFDVDPDKDGSMLDYMNTNRPKRVVPISELAEKYSVEGAPKKPATPGEKMPPETARKYADFYGDRELVERAAVADGWSI